MTNKILLPFQPDAMTPAQLAAVSNLARYTGHTHDLYAYQLRRRFSCRQAIGLDPLFGIQRDHLEPYMRHLGGSGLRISSVNTMMHGVRGFFRFAHIDGLITIRSRAGHFATGSLCSVRDVTQLSREPHPA